MIGPLLGLAVFAFLGWVAAMFMIGLWYGEQGRRKAAEQYHLSGQFDGPRAARLPDPADAETLAMSTGRAAANAAFSAQTIERGIRQLMEEARIEGRPLTEAQAREQATLMLHGAMEDPDLPQFP